jgi:hypothetical protein
LTKFLQFMTQKSRILYTWIFSRLSHFRQLRPKPIHKIVSRGTRWTTSCRASSTSRRTRPRATLEPSTASSSVAKRCLGVGVIKPLLPSRNLSRWGVFTLRTLCWVQCPENLGTGWLRLSPGPVSGQFYRIDRRRYFLRASGKVAAKLSCTVLAVFRFILIKCWKRLKTVPIMHAKEDPIFFVFFCFFWARKRLIAVVKKTAGKNVKNGFLTVTFMSEVSFVFWNADSNCGTSCEVTGECKCDIICPGLRNQRSVSQFLTRLESLVYPVM